MKRRIGILTSGGDCPGLNAVIRGVAKAAYEMFDAEIIGIHNGYNGLVTGDAQEMSKKQFSGILTLGGTILGTSRLTYRTICGMRENGDDVVEKMKKTYRDLKLDCLVTLGGNGTHKTANLLSSEGLNVIGLPKTIDNDIYGTDFTFGFHTAVATATEAIDRIHTTAASHSRVLVVEIMGNKVGWLTLYSGVAGGADVILLPEIPYSLKKITKAIEERADNRKGFSIIAVAEGAMSKEEANMKKQQRLAYRAQLPFDCISKRLASELSQTAGVEARHCVLGHIQRGGSPNAYDRVLSTEFGVHAAELIKNETYGVTVALRGNEIVHNKLSDIAGVAKPVPENDHVLITARNMGICMGD